MDRGMILVVSVDMSKDIMEQLVNIARAHDLPVLAVTDAWRQRCSSVTVSSTDDLLPNLHFDVKEIKEQFDEKDIKKEHSYQAVKERNKFFNRKRKG